MQQYIEVVLVYGTRNSICKRGAGVGGRYRFFKFLDRKCLFRAIVTNFCLFLAILLVLGHFCLFYADPLVYLAPVY